MRRRAARIDPNQPDIVRALRAAGASVESLSSAGGGVPDLLVGYHGRNLLMEVKEPEGPKGGASRHGQSLTTDQVAWHERWRGTVYVVRSAPEAVARLLD